MNNLDSIFTSISLISVFIKLFGIVFGALYLFFAIIMIRQIDIMKAAIQIEDRGVLILIAYLQTFFAAIIFIYALLIL